MRAEFLVNTPTVISAPPADEIFVSFIMCTNRPDRFRSTIAAFAELTSLMRERKLELVVVGPEDLENVGGHGDPSIRFERTIWGRRGTSRNQGFRTARGSWVYFVDQDVNLAATPAFVASLRSLAWRTGISLIGAPYLSTSSSTFWGRRYNWLANFWLAHAIGPRFLAGNVVMRKSDFGVGPYDESLLSGGEEIDVCERLRSRGGRACFEPTFALEHVADHDLAKLWSRLRGHAAFKRKTDFAAKKSRVRLVAILGLLRQPIEGVGLAVHAFAAVAARMSQLTWRESLWRTCYRARHHRWSRLVFSLPLAIWAEKNSARAARLHRQWCRRVRLAMPAVEIPCDGGAGAILACVSAACDFGCRRLVFGSDVTQLPDVIEVAQEISRRGLTVTVFHDDGVVMPEVSGLEAFGWTFIPILDASRGRDANALPSRWAVRPGVSASPRAFENEAATVSVLGFGESDPRVLYRFGLALAKSERTSRCEYEQVWRPFSESGSRVQRGRAVRICGGDGPVPEWSVVIPCYGNPHYVISVIRHVAAQNYRSAAIEAIVVDDGSENPLLELLGRELAAVRITVIVVRLERDDGVGNFDDSFRAGVARNAGILAARGRKLLFLDSDILLAEDHLLALDAALERSDVVQSVRRMVRAEASDRSVRELDESRDVYSESAYWENFKRTRDWNRLRAPWKYVCSYALALKRETLEGIGFFRPEFSEYGFEDVEIGYRLHRAGARFELLKKPVYHLYPQDRSWRAHFDEKTRFETLSRTAQLFFRMHGDPSIYLELRSFFGQG